MSQTTDIIGELVRDANRMARLDASHKRHVLKCAVATIEDLRGAAGIPKGPGHDILADIKTTVSAAGLG
ncbi:hypothetical protein [Rhizobium skierniewicense]|uniref:hypothetical protein n=1 Tax=Rhizobium skierniewicense TaxID=984260 RepID=UPI001F28B1BD|nr:hypothetical protein [Rhizobium skierniewicense]